MNSTDSRLRIATLAIAMAFGAGAVAAQSPAATPPDTAAARRLKVSLLTFGQGSAVFERFGHNAIRIVDPTTGLDVSWNWGMFSFEEPNFLGRFLRGTSRYWMAGFETATLLSYYQENDRHTIEQELNLSGAQKLELLRFVRWHELEENRFYRYDYFRDNCSTRVRDALDRVLSGALKRAWADSVGDHTHRSEALRLTEGAPLSRLGIDIALGPRADARMTAWDEAYVPMRLRDRLRGVAVSGAGGIPVSLVAGERILFAATRDPEAAAPRTLPGAYLTAALGALLPLALFGGFAFISGLRGRWPAAQRVSRLAVAGLSAVWYATTGLAGLLVAFMEIFSAHVFWYGNWNVLLLSPAGLAAAWFVPLAIVTGRGAATARWLAGICAACALVALAVAVGGATTQATSSLAVTFAPTAMYLGLLVPALTLIEPDRA